MIPDDLFKVLPYSLPQAEKEAALLLALKNLTEFHQLHCSDYAKLLKLFYSHNITFNKLSDIPYIPVNLFKTKELFSIPRQEVFKILQSSGTTSSNPSKIFLDSSTAMRQTMALANIMTSLLGNQRLPMLVLDHSSVIHDRQSYSARGAAIVGMLSFGRDVCYAFNEDMKLDRKRVNEWLMKYRGVSSLVFGLTYVVWQHFIAQLNPNEMDLAKSILIHTGGWKKLKDLSVSNEEFKNQVCEVTGIKRCHNFYGMVEQVGGVFLECKHGYLHCPQFADVIIRDPRSWQEAIEGKEGVIQVLSQLPTSYPGHSLLTEDLGVLCGVDDCQCGRKGKYFHVMGRVPQAEMRGCSDTLIVGVS